MAEFQTNPSHVAEFGDIALGDVGILDRVSGYHGQIDLIDGVRRLRVEATIAGVVGQVQTVDTTAPLGGSATYTSSVYDNLSYESMGVSLYLERGSGDTSVAYILEHSVDGAGNWREQDRQTITLTAGRPTFSLDRVYATTRRFSRIRLVNGTANALSATELVIMQKMIS